MLKKKQWLRLLRELLSKSGTLDNWTIREVMKATDGYWKAELSPGETANDILEMADETAAFYRLMDSLQPAEPTDPQPGPQLY